MMETDEEIKGKAYVHWRSWQDTYPGIICQDYLDGFTLEKCEKTAFQWRDGVIIAKQGEDVIGFVGYGNCRDEDAKEYGEIFSIYVLQDHHGKGIGRRLMEEAFRMLKDRQKIVLWVAKENRRAIRFYEKLGFRFDGKERTLQLGCPLAEVRMFYSQAEEESS